MKAGSRIAWLGRQYLLTEDLTPCKRTATVTNRSGKQVTLELSWIGGGLYGRVGNRFGKVKADST